MTVQSQQVVQCVVVLSVCGQVAPPPAAVSLTEVAYRRSDIQYMILILPANELESLGPTPSIQPDRTSVLRRHFG